MYNTKVPIYYQMLTLLEVLQGDAVSMVKQAIKGAQSLRFTYEGRKRVVEPFTMGIHKSSGKQVVVAWLKRGYSQSMKSVRWRMYRLDRMSNVTLVKQEFRAARPGFNPPDSRLTGRTDMTQNYNITTGKQKTEPQPPEKNASIWNRDTRKQAKADRAAGLPSKKYVKPVHKPVDPDEDDENNSD